MSIVHQQETFYNAIPYNPLVWSTHVLVTTLTTNTLDTSTNTNLYDGSTSTFCETNAIAVTNEKKLIKWDRQQVTPNCPSMKRPLRMWVRNFTAGSLTFLVNGVAPPTPPDAGTLPVRLCNPDLIYPPRPVAPAPLYAGLNPL